MSSPALDQQPSVEWRTMSMSTTEAEGRYNNEADMDAAMMRKRPRDQDDESGIKRLRTHDRDRDRDRIHDFQVDNDNTRHPAAPYASASAYLHPAALDQFSPYKDQDATFGAIPHPAQRPPPPPPPPPPLSRPPQSPAWAMPPQPQHPQQQQQHQQSQYYTNVPPVYPVFSAVPEWSQPQPQPQPQPQHTANANINTNQNQYNSVFDNWDYQIDEPCIYGKDATQHLKLQSISTLDHLSTQIILNLAKGSLNDIMLLTAGRDYEESQAYFTRRTLFDQTRKVYTKNSTFIDMHNLHAYTPSQQEVVRKANRATFIASILEGHDISFFDLDDRFLETFIPTGQRLLKWQGTMFLELKTQAYIAALMNNDGPSDSLLDELFPNELPDQLLGRHPDAPNLAPSEQDFLDRARARKHYLFNEPVYDAFTTLPRKYGWHDFLREFVVAIGKNVDALVSNPARTPASQPGTISPNAFANNVHSDSPVNRVTNLTSPTTPFQAGHLNQGPSDGLGVGSTQAQKTPLQHLRRLAGESSATPEAGEPKSSPQPKSRPRPAKSGGAGATQRQPWKQEEEDALMAGLAEVNGPHWSQILSLFGRGGSVSEVLKDRNQIQLKDKARNLKLWYLKMGNEVPECLRGVTGELRKRGGARVRAALGLNDDAESRPKKIPRTSAGSPRQNGGQGDSSSGTPGGHIDPSLE